MEELLLAETKTIATMADEILRLRKRLEVFETGLPSKEVLNMMLHHLDWALDITSMEHKKTRQNLHAANEYIQRLATEGEK